MSQVILQIAEIAQLGDVYLNTDNWLSAAEKLEAAHLQHAARRREWLAGRWFAKQLLREAGVAKDPAAIQILTRNEAGRGIAPQVSLHGTPFKGSLSLSHTATTVMAALVCDEHFTVGVDLAPAVQTGAGFRQLWFTPAEQQWLAAEPIARTPQLWALKEALYKAGNTGESWAPQQLEILAARFGWHCSYRGTEILPMRIEVTTHGTAMAALVCLPKHQQFARRQTARETQHSA